MSAATATLLDRARAQISLIRNALRLLRSAGDRPLAGLAVVIVANGLCPPALVFVTQRTVDRLVTAVRANGDATVMLPLVLWAAFAGTIMLLTHVLEKVAEWKRTVYEERLQELITERIHAQSVRLDLAFYESPEFFDRLHRAREEAGYRPAELCRAFVAVLQGLVTLAGLAALLVAFGPWLPAVIVLGALPIVYVVATHALAYQRWKRGVTEEERRAWYFDHVLTSADHAPELRLFETDGHFRAGHRRLRAKLRDEQLTLLWRRGLAETAAGACGVLVMGGTVAWMTWRAVLGLVSLGQLAAFYQAFAAGLTTTRSLLSHAARLHTNAVFVENLFEFLALEPRIVSPRVPAAVAAKLRSGVRFRNVTFRYPGAVRPALERFDLFVAAGQTAAIVGPNGAGKSTLVKLLCRLYDPLDGSIELDGIDIRRFDLRELRGRIAALFQPPVQHYASVDDNIRIGSLSSDITTADVRRASMAAGASSVVERLPHGYDTMLGALFSSGVELSAGEWQRVALARTLARPAQILALDEPTSALDPWAEGDWYRRVMAAASGRTTLIITHRLATARQADVIHIMEHGRIVESGNHDELVRRSERYASCWMGAAEGVLCSQP